MAKKYKAAICDDSTADITYIESLLNIWADKENINIDVEKFTSAESFLFRFSEEKSFDILLLDIEMGGMDGVSMAKLIRKENYTAEIIFITGYSDYISEGYEVAALHYLMKPVNENKLFEVLSRAVNKIKKNEKSLSVELNDEMVLIPLYEIRYLEVIKNYVTIHAKSDYTVRKTLGDFEKELDDRFYRLGRSFIINLTDITRVTKTEVHLKDGTSIPLPRGQYENLNRTIIARN